MARKRRALTQKEIEARRKNAQKCTGPRTEVGKRRAALNALKHGCYAWPSARPMPETMTALGEDPQRFRGLLSNIVQSYPPQNPFQLRICEEIAGLLWQLERNQQAQEGKLLRAVEKLEMDRHRRLKQTTTATSYDALQAEVLKTGLRLAPNSPAKFSELNACLAALSDRVAQRDFSDETELRALYGQGPTFLGAGIVNAFRTLAQAPADAPLDRSLYAGLKRMIAEESRNVNEEYQYYFREYIDISRAMRQECRAPAHDPEYIQLKREEARIHRQLERKITLYLRMREKKEAVRAARQPGWREVLEQLLSPAGEDARVSASEPGEPPVTPSPAREPKGAPEAAEVSLRHKMVKVEGSSLITEKKASHEDMIRRIRQIYGLDKPAAPGPSREPQRVAEKPRPADAETGRSGSEGEKGEGVGETNETNQKS